MANKASTNEEGPSSSEIGDFEGEIDNTLLTKSNKEQPTKQAGNIPTGIEANKAPELARFLFILGIRHVDKHTTRALTQAFSTLEHVHYAPEPILACPPDIGTVVAYSIAHFFTQEAQQAMIDELLVVSIAPQSQAATIPPLRHAEPQHWAAHLPNFKISRAKTLVLWELVGQSIEGLQTDKALSAGWQA